MNIDDELQEAYATIARLDAEIEELKRKKQEQERYKNILDSVHHHYQELERQREKEIEKQRKETEKELDTLYSQFCSLFSTAESTRQALESQRLTPEERQFIENYRKSHGK